MTSAPESVGTERAPVLVEVARLCLAARSGSFSDRAWRIMMVHLLVMTLNHEAPIAQQWERLLLCAACIALVLGFQHLDRWMSRFT